MQTGTVFDTKPLLRPEQVQRAKDEIKSLEAKLQNKHIEDKGEVSRQLRRAKKDFETQLPRPPANPEEEGRMVRRSKELLEQITQGMCSQEEMRKAPPGAVDKHIAWERSNKTRIAEWKNIMLRLTAGSGQTDAANLERHRPTTSTLNMDSAFIPGKQIYLPDVTSGRGVTFTEAQLAVLRQLSPEIADRIGSLDNATRAKVKETVEGIGLSVEKPRRVKKAAKRERKPMTPEQRQAMEERLVKARAKAAEMRAQKAQQG